MTTTELLNKLESEIESMIEVTERDFLPLPERVLNKKENPVSWSILECYEHLNRYCRYYNPVLAERLGRAGDVTPSLPVKYSWLGKRFIATMHPSNTSRQKTLKHLDPINSFLSAQVITDFLEHQKTLLQLIRSAGHRNINKVKIPLEFFRLLRLNATEMLEFLVVHQQRHFKQLERIRKFAHAERADYLKV